ncbi:uncharacterized protein LOC128238870 [Mya arenaria]|uniref:uncharacterized protein LOC128238870 n=1 Tax=Mya arenaria TaxID=6604 RepID=UPI0022E32A72|nr:uncharacterized protein LOC128238870 [Mya arenaria]
MGSAGAALLLSILLQCASVFAVKVSYTCHETTVADKEFRLNFRLDPESNTDITGVKTYVSPTVLTSPECSATLSGGIYELSTTIDVGTSECGATLDSGTVYKMLVRAEGTVNYYEIQCDTPSLLKSTVKTSEFQTSAVKSNYMHRPNPTDVKFQVVEADGSYVPTSNVYEGQDIKLRLIYNKGAIEYGPQNLGYVFHTGSTPHFGETELIIQIMTPGLGTEVKIEGQLDGNEFIYYSKVKRDSAVEITIPNEYYGPGNGAGKSNWKIVGKAIKITALHDRIGVKVISRAIGSFTERSFIAIPDDAVSHDSTYEYTLHNIDAVTAQVIAIPFGSSTINVAFNDYDAAADNVKIDGTAVVSGSTNENVMLSEYDVFELRCGPSAECANIHLTSSEPFVVLVTRATGTFSSYDEDLATMLLPSHNSAERYVLFYPPSFDNSYTMVDPVDDQRVSFLTPGGLEQKGGSTENYNYFDKKRSQFSGFTGDAFEIMSDNPIAVYGVFPDNDPDSTEDRATFTLPSISQWGVRQYFYATEGRKYDLYFVAYKTDMAEIKLKLGTITTSFTGPSLGDAASFSTNRADVPRVQGETGVRFEYFFLLDFEVEDTDAFAIESGLVEFRSRRPFMLMIIEKAADGKLRQAYSPWGVRYPTTNLCTPTTSDHTFSPAFGASFSTKPGDLLDNDCDGLVDEELNNGINDDGAINGDTNVDEDLALGEIYERGIEVDKLVFDVLGSFGSSNMETVISGGCNTEAEIFSDIGTFSHNTDLSSLFDDYWVLDSETFDAFKITSESDVYFQVEYDVCYDGDLETTCANPTCRKRRSSDRKKEGSGRRAITSLKLHRNDSTEIKDAIREEKPEYEKDDIIFGHPCFSSVEFWTRVGGLLAIILMEASMIGGMLAYKRRVLNSFK